jgi:hypothetical protein
MFAAKWESTPENAVLFHRIGVVVAEVTMATMNKAAERIASAKLVVDELRRLVPVARHLVEDSPELSGPAAARELRSLHRVFAAGSVLKKILPKFIDEHGPLIEDDIKSTMTAFVDWIPVRERALRQAVESFEDQVSAELRRDAEPIGQLAEAWSIVDADGL